MDNWDQRLLRISDLEKLTGASRKTIHYYLSRGLLSEPLRTGKTMAYYDQKHVEDLRTIRKLREKGYPLVQIKEMVHAEPCGESADDDRYRDIGIREQQLMEKAVELFSKRGFHKTKVSDITNAVGMAPSSFYVYFPSKEALFIDCLDRVFKLMFEDAVDEIIKEENPLRRLRLRAEIALKSHRQFFDILQILKAGFEGDPKFEAKRKEIYALIHKPLKKNLQQAVDEGLLPPMNLDIAAYVFINVLETAMLISSLEGGIDADEFLNTVDILLLSRNDPAPLPKVRPPDKLYKGA